MVDAKLLGKIFGILDALYSFNYFLFAVFMMMKKAPNLGEELNWFLYRFEAPSLGYIGMICNLIFWLVLLITAIILTLNAFEKLDGKPVNISALLWLFCSFMAFLINCIFVDETAKGTVDSLAATAIAIRLIFTAGLMPLVWELLNK